MKLRHFSATFVASTAQMPRCRTRSCSLHSPSDKYRVELLKYNIEILIKLIDDMRLRHLCQHSPVLHRCGGVGQGVVPYIRPHQTHGLPDRRLRGVYTEEVSLEQSHLHTPSQPHRRQ